MNLGIGEQWDLATLKWIFF